MCGPTFAVCPPVPSCFGILAYAKAPAHHAPHCPQASQPFSVQTVSPGSQSWTRLRKGGLCRPRTWLTP